MKRFMKSLSAALLVLIATFQVNADIIPANSHAVERCVTITNVSQFSSMIFVAVITGPMIKGYETQIVSQGQCLSKGYKFNTLRLCALEKEYLSEHDLNSINFLEDQNVVFTDSQIETWGGYVTNENTLAEEEIYYTIAGISGTKLIVYKSKHVYTYENQKTKTEVFEKPQIDNIRTFITAVIKNEELTSESIIVSPVPTQNIVSIDLRCSSKGEIEIQVIDITGQTIKTYTGQKQARQYTYEINVSNLPNGIYLLDITIGSFRRSRKFIKQ